MKKAHRFLACTAAAILTFSTSVQALESALDPLRICRPIQLNC